MKFIKELFSFLLSRKKLWLAPVIFVMWIFGGLILITQGTVVSPFIYTLF